MRHFWLALTAAVSAIALSSCNSGSAASGNGSGRPAVLRFAYTSTLEDAGAAALRIEPFTRYLERTLHVRVEATKTTGYAGVIEAFRANKIDMASISPFSYVLATQRMAIEAIVMRGGKDGEPGEYTGVLAVPGNSPIKSIDDLKKHAHELTISFVDPASASGFLVQSAFLQSIGLEPQRDFRKVVFSMNHLASLMTLKAGKVDVAASMQRLIDRYQTTGNLAKGEVRVLWVSPEIPNQPIAVRKDLPAAFKEEIRRALIDMNRNDPAAFDAQMSAKMRALMGPRASYVAANDAMFDGLRKMASGVKNLSLLEN